MKIIKRMTRTAAAIMMPSLPTYAAPGKPSVSVLAIRHSHSK
jgi:hypothetical protein